MVLTEENAEDFVAYKKKPSYIQPSEYLIETIDDVELPEDGSRQRSWVIANLTIQQKQRNKETHEMSGTTYVPLEELAECQAVSWKYLDFIPTLSQLYPNFIPTLNDFIPTLS